MLVPFAGAPAAATRGLPLPQLQRLLALLAPAPADAGSADSLSMPHERALAGACGLPATDGLVPLAAQAAHAAGLGQPGEGWAWITPCHWRVGTDHIAMADPQDLRLDEAQSRALLEAMRPWFAEDGIALHYQAPLRWLARAELFRALPTASLDRVLGRDVDPWLPRSASAAPLRRLQQEMQMLLYTLPLNEERERGGLQPVNSFWASGTGALPADAATGPPAGLRVATQLREPALQGDWAAWRAAWERLDGEDCAQLLHALAAGRPARLTLCGERHARSWSSAGAGFWRRALATFNKPSPAALLEAL